MRKIKIMLKVASLGVGVLLLGAVLVYAIYTGPRDLAAYPDPAESPYLLPWPGGEARFCIQGVRAVVSHRGTGEHAWDFTMPVGSDVCAARAGKVIAVVQHHDGNGSNMPNNKVVVQHEDGTHGHYLHLKRNGSKVKEGDTVEQGGVIAESGNVGRSMLPHLHFQVVDPETRLTIPVTFADVDTDQGIPRMFKTYVSGNREHPPQTLSMHWIMSARATHQSVVAGVPTATQPPTAGLQSKRNN